MLPTVTAWNQSPVIPRATEIKRKRCLLPDDHKNKRQLIRKEKKNWQKQWNGGVWILSRIWSCFSNSYCSWNDEQTTAVLPVKQIRISMSSFVPFLSMSIPQHTFFWSFLCQTYTAGLWALPGEACQAWTATVPAGQTRRSTVCCCCWSFWHVLFWTLDKKSKEIEKGSVLRLEQSFLRFAFAVV